MKALVKLSFILISLFIASCSGSDTYQGNWKAIDNDGNKIQIRFAPKQMTLNKKNYDYTQNSISINNDVKTYGISLDDGRSYLIKFPLTNDSTKAIIMDPFENVIYVMCRTQYLTIEELYKLN